VLLGIIPRWNRMTLKTVVVCSSSLGTWNVPLDSPDLYSPWTQQSLKLPYGYGSKPWYLVNIKIAGKWMFIPLKMYL
jgi:hypothetical protein